MHLDATLGFSLHENEDGSIGTEIRARQMFNTDSIEELDSDALHSFVEHRNILASYIHFYERIIAGEQLETLICDHMEFQDAIPV